MRRPRICGLWGLALIAWLLIAGSAWAGGPGDRIAPGETDAMNVPFRSADDSALPPIPSDAADTSEATTEGGRGLRRGAQKSAGQYAIRRDAAGPRSSPFELGGSPWYRSGLVSVCVVLGLVWLIYRITRKWIPGSKVRDIGVLRVVARTTLTPKQHVALVRLGRRFVMVGVSPDRIDRLCVIDEAAEVSELIVRTDGDATTRSSGFDAELIREMGDYDPSYEDEVDQAAVSCSTSTARRPPLQELVSRLRSLQND